MDRKRGEWRSEGRKAATQLTSKKMTALLPEELERITKRWKDRPDLVIAAWPHVIGERLSQMTKALSFDEGVLIVAVNNSTLYALLTGPERARLTKELQSRFPQAGIRAIHFRIG